MAEGSEDSRPWSEVRALCSALGLGSEPQEPIRTIERLYARLDGEISERSRGLDLPCREGCDACCHESVFLSAPEFLYVVFELVQTRTLAELREIREAMGRLAEQFEDELELLETIEPGPERDEVAARVKFRCPLLGADGRCRVYRARELNARTFGESWDSLRAAPYGCALTHERLGAATGLVLLGGARAQPQTPHPDGREPPRGSWLFGSREARAILAEAFPSVRTVHVFPWWFRRYDAFLPQ